MSNVKGKKELYINSMFDSVNKANNHFTKCFFCHFNMLNMLHAILLNVSAMNNYNMKDQL